MKKLKMIVAAIAAAGLLASCTVYRTVEVTGAPVGTKKGVAKSQSFMNNYRDYSLQTAAKNGGITTIGSWEYSKKMFLFIQFDKTVVTGE